MRELLNKILMEKECRVHGEKVLQSVRRRGCIGKLSRDKVDVTYHELLIARLRAIVEVRSSRYRIKVKGRLMLVGLLDRCKRKCLKEEL